MRAIASGAQSSERQRADSDATGATSGIGRATALIFAREGANLLCADLNEEAAAETAAQVNGKGGQAPVQRIDVTRRAEVNDMVERAIATFSSV